MTYVGIDFGTTNSTLAISDAEGHVELTSYTVQGKRYDTFRSVLHFDAEKRSADNAPLATCGIEGIFAYLQGGSNGRFVQSVKSYLASRSFKNTNIFHRVFSLEQLITLIVSQLKAKAQRELPDAVVVGRPVHFVNDDEDETGDAYAEGRLRTAIEAAGFKRVHFTFEPVAAAYQYEATLKKDELVLIADFGGGTTDLCLVDVGPGQRQKGERRVRATAGVALAGDAFDQRIIHHAIAPQLGLGTKYRVFGGDADVPTWLYSSLARWHLLSFLKSPRTMQTLDTICANAHDKHAMSTLRRIVDDDLGYDLHQAVERAKIALSSEERTALDFDAGTIACNITRAEFESWIAPDLAKISGAIDEVLTAAALDAKVVDRVFLTGGTSLVPAVRALFASRFGEDKLRGGEEMTSVGRGLGLVARDVFGV
jgi:hypothetical chaperone protein